MVPVGVCSVLMDTCCGLNVSVPPKVMCGNANTQCNGIRRWALGRCLGHESGSLKNGRVFL